MLTMYLLYGPEAYSVDIDRTGAPIDYTHGTQKLLPICFTINTSTRRINDDMITSYGGLMTHFLLQVPREKKKKVGDKGREKDTEKGRKEGRGFPKNQYTFLLYMAPAI